MVKPWVALGLALSLSLASGSAAAQSSFTKVTLKTGEVLEGTVLDELPGGGLKLLLLDGSARALAGAEIASILRPGAKPAAPDSPEPSRPPDAPAEPSRQAPPAASRERGEAGESCQARSDCAEGLACFNHVCATAAAATPPAPAASRGDVAPEADPTNPAPEEADFDGFYGGGLVGGAAAPAFPGVAGVGGGAAFFGWRGGWFDLRVALGGFGAGFPNGSMGVAVIRPETFFWVAEPYGFGAGLGPCVGHYEDGFIESLLYGGLASVTPVALRFEAGDALLEPSLSGGVIFGGLEASSGDVLARPFALLGFAVYSR